MAHEMVSMDLSRRLRYVPLLAAGLVVFLGLLFLGGLTGLLWHIHTFDWWVKLNPTVVGPRADWLIWAFCFLLSVAPAIAALARRGIKSDPVLFLTSLFFPVLSVMTVGSSYFVGVTLLVGSGFFVTYTLVSRSGRLLGIEGGYAMRLVCIEVFALLSVASAGGVVSVLLWRSRFFLAMASGSSLDPVDDWLGMLAIDMEVFYLVRPLLTAVFMILAVAAVVNLFGEPFRSVRRLLSGRGITNEDPAANSPGPALPQAREHVAVRRWLPYLILAGSVALGMALTLYPYFVVGFEGVLGVDSWFYIRSLNSMSSPIDAVKFLETGRSFFLLLLFSIRAATGLSTEWVVRLTPALLAALLAVSSFVLVREGTGRSWLAALVAILSVISAQTALGMSAGIINNWFALSIANFMFALIVRSIRIRSKLLTVASLLVSIILLASYAFLWVVVLAELVFVLVASIISFRNQDRGEWKREVAVLSGLLFCSIALPIGLLLLGNRFLGYGLQGVDPSHWLGVAWVTFTGVRPVLLGSVLAVFEEALVFAGNRIDLPLLTLLSVVGLLDWASQRRCFSKIMGATVLVPLLLTVVISASSEAPYTPMWLTWRGLYIIPLFLTGALGIESIIRKVNGSGSPWGNRSRLAFAGTFTAYILLSYLSYSLRALELLIMVASG